jgi:hypothetical protein
LGVTIYPNLLAMYKNSGNSKMYNKAMTTDRQILIKDLETKFQPFTDELLNELRHQSFTFKEQKVTHHSHLDQELIIRHALPYCITEEAYFTLDDKDVKFFAAVILLHSLALTRIDDYYDGGDKTKAVEPLNVHALAYSMSATHEAIQSLLKLSTASRELRRMLSVTTFVHSRMYKDYRSATIPSISITPIISYAYILVARSHAFWVRDIGR